MLFSKVASTLSAQPSGPLLLTIVGVTLAQILIGAFFGRCGGALRRSGRSGRSLQRAARAAWAVPPLPLGLRAELREWQGPKLA